MTESTNERCFIQELIVSKWESFLHPRSILPAIESASGVCHAHVTDTFGHNGTNHSLGYSFHYHFFYHFLADFMCKVFS